MKLIVQRPMHLLSLVLLYQCKFYLYLNFILFTKLFNFFCVGKVSFYVSGNFTNNFPLTFFNIKLIKSAPMSKVIGFLPSNIPRILINRNIVKPAKPTVEEIESKNEEEGDEDFRNGYVFDACLLGFCDDVTRSLVKGLESIDSIEMGKNAALSLAMKEGKLLCNETENLDLKIRGLYNHPTDRVFLFPGAVVEMETDSDSAVIYKEVAHCDGCQELIEGAIMKCTDCFDYDLCLTCYPLLSKKHFQGKHTFVAER